MSLKMKDQIMASRHERLKAEATIRATVEAEAETLKQIAREGGLPEALAAEWMDEGLAPDQAREAVRTMQAKAHAQIWARFNGRQPAADKAPKGEQ